MIAFREVAKSEFQLSFDGAALRGGAMDASELGASLLAIGDLVREANYSLNGERSHAKVSVKSDFKRGSFEVFLVLDHSLLEAAKQFLLPGAVVGSAALIKLLFGTEAGKTGAAGAFGSVLDIWKKLKGEKPKETKETEAKGKTIIVYGDNNQIHVDSKVANLYERESIRRAIAGVAKPLSTERIESLEIRKGERIINQIHKSDLPPATDLQPRALLSTSEDVRVSSREAVLRVETANFEKGKWRFHDGGASFNADIADLAFKQKLDAREIGFYKGDTLHVMLNMTQNISNGQSSNTRYSIEKVLEHRHAPKQTGFV